MVLQLGYREIVAVDIEGNSEVMARVPTTIPFSIDWLPDGRMIVVSGPEARLLRHEPDGTLVTHADLSGLVDGFINEIVVDPHGNAYVNGGDFDFSTGAGVESGSSRWCIRTARRSRWPTTSRSATVWPSPKTARR